MCASVKESDFDQARRVLQDAAKVFVLTGAGISVGSGVPTFRGSGGYWRDIHYSELATPQAFERDPALVWGWYCERRQTVAACEPNAAHHALVRFASSRSNVVLVTQNVDGLHERAGHLNVIRLHGSLWKNRCTACTTERDVSDLTYSELPHSPCCGALERPAVVWFDEPVPRAALDAALYGLVRVRALLVIGTSGKVYPAARLIRIAAHYIGVPVIEINPEVSDISSTFYFRGEAGDLVPKLFGM